MTETQIALDEMLKENTGRHILDSGGAYGRNWERNQDINFDEVPPIDLRFNRWKANDGKFYQDVEMSFHIYHWLDNILDYEKKLDEMFLEWCEYDDPDNNKSWLELAGDWIEEIFENGLPMEDELLEVTGLYGDKSLPQAENTYNSGDDFLSQTLLFTYLEIDDIAMVMLSIHGGCDVRGGYTRPRMFSLKEETAIFDFQRGSICCTNMHRIPQLNGTERDACGYRWFTDDAYHWGVDDSSIPELNDIEFRVEGDDLSMQEVGPDQRGKDGFLHIDQDGNGYCPNCGQKLEGWYY